MGKLIDELAPEPVPNGGDDGGDDDSG
jgi:hypothetical protein